MPCHQGMDVLESYVALTIKRNMGKKHSTGYSVRDSAVLKACANVENSTTHLACFAVGKAHVTDTELFLEKTVASMSMGI